MATRSTIAVQNADGTVTGIYCHWDGYLSHNGRLLQDHYNTEELARELVSVGDISSLNERCKPAEGEVHSYDKPAKGVTVYYGRDRGEDKAVAQTYDHWARMRQENGQEFNYLFIPGQGWFVEFYGREGMLENMFEDDEAEA